MNKKLLIEYHSNNSGGNEWLTEQNWKDLKKAGWKLFSYGNFVYINSNRAFGKDNLPKRKGVVGFPSYGFKRFDSIGEALQEFEKITGSDVTAEGCNCCGAPHEFRWDGGYCSGESCGEYLTSKDFTKYTKRELIEMLENK